MAHSGQLVPHALAWRSATTHSATFGTNISQECIREGSVSFVLCRRKFSDISVLCIDRLGALSKISDKTRLASNDLDRIRQAFGHGVGEAKHIPH